MMARRRPSEVASRSLDEALRPFPEMAPFVTPVREITCRQGAHAYVARRLALRAERILFHDPRTDQLGIARLQGEEAVDAMQYPFARVAVIMFLGGVEALEAE